MAVLPTPLSPTNKGLFYGGEKVFALRAQLRSRDPLRDQYGLVRLIHLD